MVRWCMLVLVVCLMFITTSKIIIIIIFKVVCGMRMFVFREKLVDYYMRMVKL